MTSNDDAELGALTGAELRCAREAMGLTVEDLAVALGVYERTVRRWEDGTSTVPTGAAADMARLRRRFDDEVADLVTHLATSPSRVTAAHRSDRYRRAVLARAREQVPDLRIVWERGDDPEAS